MAETRKIAAILAADVVGFSRMASADEDRTLARLRALRADLIDPTIAGAERPCIQAHRRRALVEFRSVVDAVRCAIEVQNGMVERNAGVPPEERRIEFRVGIHLGDVVEESDGDLMGDGVNIAARLKSVRARNDLSVRGRLSSGEGAARSRGKRSRPDATQEHRRADPGLFARSRPSGPGEARAAGPAQKTEPPRLSIVVLPFKNLSSDPGQDYFADGVTENLTTDLSRIRNSFVIARNTAFTFKGKAVDAKQISKELGVRYVLEGSVQRDQSRVRVNAQLIDAQTGAHLWADRFQEASPICSSCKIRWWRDSPMR